MIKSELIQQIAEDNPHLYQRDVERIVSTLFEEITAALARGDRVELRGFGAFSVKKRDARMGRNPRTGAAVPVPEKTVPFFKAVLSLPKPNGTRSISSAVITARTPRSALAAAVSMPTIRACGLPAKRIFP